MCCRPRDADWIGLDAFLGSPLPADMHRSKPLGGVPSCPWHGLVAHKGSCRTAAAVLSIFCGVAGMIGADDTAVRSYGFVRSSR
jgi:hypothetical protein